MATLRTRRGYAVRSGRVVMRVFAKSNLCLSGARPSRQLDMDTVQKPWLRYHDRIFDSTEIGLAVDCGILPVIGNLAQRTYEIGVLSSKVPRPFSRPSSTPSHLSFCSTASKTHDDAQDPSRGSAYGRRLAWGCEYEPRGAGEAWVCIKGPGPKV